MEPDNAEESFKCSKCGGTFSRDGDARKRCPICGYLCTRESCPSLGASNEDY